MPVIHYFNIKPRVMVEELIDDGHADGPLDYRIWCFDGKPEAIQMDNKPHTLSAFYNTDWKPLYATYRVKERRRDIERPSNLNEMLSVAANLSTGFDFVRIDLYSVNGKTYFGEFTFAPTAGCNKFDPPHWDCTFESGGIRAHVSRHPATDVREARRCPLSPSELAIRPCCCEITLSANVNRTPTPTFQPRECAAGFPGGPK